MSDAYDSLQQSHIDFIARQKMFFVATAPLEANGHVNVSPKGYDALRVLDASHVEWIDLGGSGIETQAHLQENGRITLMFCAFEGPANILRIYGRGEAIDFDHPDFAAALDAFPNYDRARAIIRIKIDRVSDSCGWGVPFYEFKSEREQLNRWLEHKPVDEWQEKRRTINALSIDGLKGLSGN